MVLDAFSQSYPLLVMHYIGVTQSHPLRLTPHLHELSLEGFIYIYMFIDINVFTLPWCGVHLDTMGL